MSVKTIRPARNLGAAQTDNDWSPGVWYDCPYFAIKDGELPGAVFDFDFDTLPKTPATTEGNFGLFTQFSDAGGFINAGTGVGGEWVIGSDGDNEGASIRSRSTPFKIIRTGKKLWFEARVKTSTVADSKNGFLLGLIQDVAFTATMPITAAGAIADTNLVGFRKDEADGDQIDCVYKADGVTAVTVQADALPTALVADTYVKLGMVFEPSISPFVQDPTNAGTTKYNLTFLVNGIKVATKQIPAAAGTDFPNDVSMGFFFACLNATASTPGDNTIDKVRIAQLY